MEDQFVLKQYQGVNIYTGINNLNGRGCFKIRTLHFRTTMLIILILNCLTGISQCFPTDGAGYYSQELPPELGEVYDISISSNGTSAIIGENGIAFLTSKGIEPGESYFTPFSSLGVDPNLIIDPLLNYRFSQSSPSEFARSVASPQVKINNGEAVLVSFNEASGAHYLIFYKSNTGWSLGYQDFIADNYATAIALGASNIVNSCSFMAVNLFHSSGDGLSHLKVFKYCLDDEDGPQIHIEDDDIPVGGLVQYLAMEQHPTVGFLNVVVAATLNYQSNQDFFYNGNYKIISNHGGLWNVKATSTENIDVLFPLHFAIGQGVATVNGLWSPGFGFLMENHMYSFEFSEISLEEISTFHIPTSVGCEEMVDFRKRSRSNSTYFFEHKPDHITIGQNPNLTKVVVALDKTGDNHFEPEGFREIYLPNFVNEGLDFLTSGGRCVAAVERNYLMHWDLDHLGMPIPAGAEGRVSSEAEETEQATLVNEGNSLKFYYKSVFYQGEATLVQYTLDGKEQRLTTIYLEKGLNEFVLPPASIKQLTIFSLTDKSGKKLWSTKAFIKNH
ncbi:MAG: hypothetical protein RIM99_01735 [Cyclobacteriaceae bacterium]